MDNIGEGIKWADWKISVHPTVVWHWFTTQSCTEI